MTDNRQGTKIETEREAREEAWHDRHFEGGKMPQKPGPRSLVHNRAEIVARLEAVPRAIRLLNCLIVPEPAYSETGIIRTEAVRNTRREGGADWIG